MTGPGPGHWLLVWREPQSSRLRTYTDFSDRPIASLLRNITPLPTTFISIPDELDAWLRADPDPQDTVAISAELARSYLGWDPVTFDL